MFCAGSITLPSLISSSYIESLPFAHRTGFKSPSGNYYYLNLVVWIYTFLESLLDIIQGKIVTRPHH